MRKQHTVGRLWERQPSAQQQTLPAGPDWSEGSDTPPRVLGAGEGTAPALGPGTAGEDRARARPANRPRNAHFRGPPAAPSQAHTSERGPEGLPQPSTWPLGQDTVSAAGNQGRGSQSSPPPPAGAPGARGHSPTPGLPVWTPHESGITRNTLALDPFRYR